MKRCCLQLDNLDKIIFVSKNWSNDLRVGCGSPSSLIELIELDVALQEKIEQYKGEFEQDELLDL